MNIGILCCSNKNNSTQGYYITCLFPSNDVQTLGNHEFDFGPAGLATYLKQIDFPMLGGCNVDVSKEPLLNGLVKKYIIKKVKGLKVAIFGILTNQTSFTSSPGPNVVFSDPAVSLAACIEEANAKHKG